MNANARLGLLLSAMVVVPLVAVGFVGWRLVGDQEALARHSVESGFGERLKSLDQAVQTIVRGYERDLARYAAELPRTTDPQALREALGRQPRTSLALVLDRKGRLVFPPLVAGIVSQRELAFLERTRPVWEGGLLESAALLGALDGKASGPDRGWIAYFFGGGQHFLWWFADGRRVVALEVSGIDLMTELVSQLPETPVAGEDTSDERTVLADATGRIVYQWGSRAPAANERPKATVGMSEPLESWTLRHFAAESTLPGAIAGTLRTALVAGLAGLGLALGAGAWLIWRARTRESRLAAQRVSFVNQVSHELKTPLTSIRMYADLLKSAHEDAELDEAEPAARHLAVITRESDRLSRLIKNVLTFARGQENRLAIARREVVADDIVTATLATHGPALAQARIAVETDLAAKASIALDPDAVEQILSNLLSNVEKYARTGGWVKVTTRVLAGPVRLVMRVQDRGPGIPTAQREQVFEPFWRASDRLSDGVTGTGIGLDIARRLARLHGGDLAVVDSEGSDGQAVAGATFELVVLAEPGPKDAS